MFLFSTQEEGFLVYSFCKRKHILDLHAILSAITNHKKVKVKS